MLVHQDSFIILVRGGRKKTPMDVRSHHHALRAPRLQKRVARKHTRGLKTKTHEDFGGDNSQL